MRATNGRGRDVHDRVAAGDEGKGDGRHAIAASADQTLSASQLTVGLTVKQPITSIYVYNTTHGSVSAPVPEAPMPKPEQ